MTKDKKAGKANLRAADLERLQVIQQISGQSSFSSLLDDLIQNTDLPVEVLALSVPEQKGVTLNEESLERLDQISGKGPGKPTQPEAFRLLIDEYCRQHKIKFKFTGLEAFKSKENSEPTFALSLLLLPDYQPLKAWGSADQVNWSDQDWTEVDENHFQTLFKTGTAVKLSKLSKELPYADLQERLRPLGVPWA